jgi:uncharacterized membrane protein
MRNRNVGFLILGTSAVIAVIVGIFNYGMKSILEQSCSHGSECAMFRTIAIQTWTSLAIAGLVAVIGLFLIFSREEEKIVVKKVKVKQEEKKMPIDYSKLDKDEKVLIKIVEQEKGAVFQSTLVEKSGFSKVKVSRILDRLQGRQIIERKRRGMTNVVILKN